MTVVSHLRIIYHMGMTETLVAEQTTLGSLNVFFDAEDLDNLYFSAIHRFGTHKMAPKVYTHGPGGRCQSLHPGAHSASRQHSGAMSRHPTINDRT